MILCFPDFSWTSEDRKARSGWKQGMFTPPEGLNQGSALTPTDTTFVVSVPQLTTSEGNWGPGCQPDRLPANAQ